MIKLFLLKIGVLFIYLLLNVVISVRRCIFSICDLASPFFQSENQIPLESKNRLHVAPSAGSLSGDAKSILKNLTLSCPRSRALPWEDSIHDAVAKKLSFHSSSV